MGGVSGESVAKTSPASTVVRSRRGPCSALQKDAGMPPLPLLPFSKAMPTRLPREVVGPRVVDALEVAAGGPAVVERDQGAAVGAAVLEGVDLRPARPAPR